MKVKFEIDLNSQEEVQTAINVLSKVLGQEAPKEQVKKEKKSVLVDKDKTITEAAEEAKTPATVAETAPATEVAKTETTAAANTSTVKIEAVRAAVAAKAATHRDKLKAELTRLGASSVTLLKEEHYEEFLTFVNGLK